MNGLEGEEWREEEEEEEREKHEKEREYSFIVLKSCFNYAGRNLWFRYCRQCA